MITTEGKLQIKRYLAGYVPSIAQSIAIGIGDSAETLGDDRLQFEVGREDITMTGYDFINDRLVFKTSLPEEYAGEVREAAIFSTSFDEVAGEFGSRLITSFDSETEDWVNVSTGLESVFTTTNMRLGIDGLRHTPATNGATTDSLPEIFLDLSGHSGADKFIFAFNVRNENVSSISFRFANDSANYYQFTLPAQTSGYKIVELTKASAVATGSPNWETITELRVTTNSKAAGGGLVDFDGIRIEDVDTLNADYACVSREVLTTPFIKERGKIQDIEFSINVSL